MRSVAVIVFIAMAAAAAIYCAQRETVARGSAIASSLMESNPTLKSMTCDDRIPIGKQGATFTCSAEFKNGDRGEFELAMNREGHIKMLSQAGTPAPRIKKTSDPWGD